jgi:N-acetylated-alpha-linked acidic dipeptidase
MIAIRTSSLVWALLLLLPASCFGSANKFSQDESLFLEVPNPESARKSLRYITSKSHVAGTPGDTDMADFVRREFLKAGIPNATQFDLFVGLNYPKAPPQVALYDSKEKLIYQAELSEDVLPQDDTSDTIWRNHTFHGYSPSGSVQGAMVYVNYGRPEDFAKLEQAGISVRDKIVLVRYGRCFRGLKVWNAQKRGAVGVLIYSDPMDDGYGQGGVYPAGPWRSESSVQRGSVLFNSLCAGDPYRADPRYKDQLNTSLKELCGAGSSKDLIPSIPSLPLSYKDATPLLEMMGGPFAFDIGGDDFCGGIRNLTYTVGPSSSTLRLVVENEDLNRTIPNIVGIIPGTLPPSEDMPVLLGNHRDAWVFGAADPNSGTAALIEVAKGLGKLYRDLGWRPIRSIYLLSWSGEEYGLLGSTGWAELNENAISRALAYLNVDTVVSGDILKVSASPSLTTLWQSVMRDFNSTANHSVSFENPPSGEMRDANTDWKWDDSPSIGTLGSGSDYTVFLDHFGVPSLDFSFGKKATYGQYHSIYDSFSWIDQFGGHCGTPGSSFEIMSFASKIWGIMAMRLAVSPLVPLSAIAQGQALSKYLTYLESQKVAGLDLKDLSSAINDYRAVAAKVGVDCSSSVGEKVVTCNEKLGLVERSFLLEEGLPGRQWFKHVLQAPGLNLGYAAEAFPGIQQAIDDQDVKVAQNQTRLAAERVKAAASFLE